MKFLHLVNEVACLANNKKTEDEELKVKHGVTKGLLLGSEEGFAFMAADRPAAKTLLAYLEGLDEPTVFKLVTVMYAGRDKNPNFRQLKDQVTSTKDDAIRTMNEKTL